MRLCLQWSRRLIPSRNGLSPSRGYFFKSATPPVSDEFEAEFTTDHSRRALKALDRDVSLGLQDAIDLGAAGIHALGKSVLVSPCRSIFWLSRQGHDAGQRFSPGRLPNAFLAEEFVEGNNAPMGGSFSCSLLHLLMRRRASSRSSAGVFRVFLMNPGATPMQSSWTKNSNRA